MKQYRGQGPRLGPLLRVAIPGRRCEQGRCSVPERVERATTFHRAGEILRCAQDDNNILSRACTQSTGMPVSLIRWPVTGLDDLAGADAALEVYLVEDGGPFPGDSPGGSGPGIIDKNGW